MQLPCTYYAMVRFTAVHQPDKWTLYGSTAHMWSCMSKVVDFLLTYPLIHSLMPFITDT